MMIAKLTMSTDNQISCWLTVHQHSLVDEVNSQAANDNGYDYYDMIEPIFV